MGKESSDRRRRRRRRIAEGADAEPPASIHSVANDLLKRILLRVGTAVSLVRAAATCKPWRRVIADDGFLRRFRRVSGPHMLGHYYQYRSGFRPHFVPLADAEPEGKPAIDCERFTLDFLPSSYFRSRPTRPVLQDSRGGLLAFLGDIGRVIVCSPWTRQHMQIDPPFPSCMPGVGKRYIRLDYLGVFLLDAGPGDEESGTGLNMSNFKLLCVRLVGSCHGDRKAVQACVFSAGDDRCLSVSAREIHDPGRFRLVGRAGGSICWSVDAKWSDLVLHLNESTGEFSYLRLPGIKIHRNPMFHSGRNLRVIGTVHLARIFGNDLEVLRFAHSGGACVVERRTCLSCHVASVDPRAGITEDRRWYFWDTTAPEAAAPGCVSLCDDECGLEYIWTFSVDAQDMRQERVQKLKPRWGDVRPFPYELPWPPPGFSACLCDDAMQEEADDTR